MMSEKAGVDSKRQLQAAAHAKLISWKPLRWYHTCQVVALALSLADCAPLAHTTESGVVTMTPTLQDSIALVAVVGRELGRRPGKPVILLRSFVQNAGEPVDAAGIKPAVTDTLIATLRQSIGASRVQLQSRPQGGYMALVDVQMSSDSGWVDVFSTPGFIHSGDPYFFSTMRYHCRRSGESWIFVRRELGLAA